MAFLAIPTEMPHSSSEPIHGHSYPILANSSSSSLSIPDSHLLYGPLQVEQKAVLEMKLQQGTQLAEQAATEMTKHSNISLQESVKELQLCTKF